MTRNGTAVWRGSGKDGKGILSTQSKVLIDVPYSYRSRFEEGVAGTNPEELVAAAHAGCFTMKLAFNLQEAGFTAEKLETKCKITIEEGTITSSKLFVKGKIKDISEDKFKELVKNASETCPVSKLLKATISVDSSLSAD